MNPDGRGEEAALFQAPPHNESIGAIPGPEGEMWVEYASVIARLVKTLVPVIETAWEPVRELQVMDVNLQTGPMSVSLNGPADPAIQVVFGLACQGQGDLALSLCYPLSVAEPSESASYT